MSNNFKRCQYFLEKNGFRRTAVLDEEYIVYSNDIIDVNLHLNEDEIIFVNDHGDFLHIPFCYYALVGALIEYHLLTFNYCSVKLTELKT